MCVCDELCFALHCKIIIVVNKGEQKTKKKKKRKIILASNESKAMSNQRVSGVLCAGRAGLQLLQLHTNRSTSISTKDNHWNHSGKEGLRQS